MYSLGGKNGVSAEPRHVVQGGLSRPLGDGGVWRTPADQPDPSGRLRLQRAWGEDVPCGAHHTDAQEAASAGLVHHLPVPYRHVPPLRHRRPPRSPGSLREHGDVVVVRLVRVLGGSRDFLLRKLRQQDVSVTAEVQEGLHTFGVLWQEVRLTVQSQPRVLLWGSRVSTHHHSLGRGDRLKS